MYPLFWVLTSNSLSINRILLPKLWKNNLGGYRRRQLFLQKSIWLDCQDETQHKHSKWVGDWTDKDKTIEMNKIRSREILNICSRGEWSFRKYFIRREKLTISWKLSFSLLALNSLGCSDVRPPWCVRSIYGRGLVEVQIS